MNKNLIMTVLGLTIGVLVLSTVLVPIVSEAQKTAGDEITLTNNSAITLRDAEPGDVLKLVRTTSDGQATDVWTLNEVPITTVTGAIVGWNSALISDGVYMQINGVDNASAGQVWRMISETPAVTYFGGSRTTDGVYVSTFTFTDTEIIVSPVNLASWSAPYTWAKVICPQGEGKYTAANPNGTGYVSNVEDVILCGAYSTGNNKTMYWQNGGDLVLSNPAYGGTTNIDSNLHDGTTDIYDVSVSVDVGGESFIPYRIYVPFEVVGHETSGGAYSLYAVLPVLIIIALMVYAISVIRNRD